MALTVLAPISGKVVALIDVDDPVFSGCLVGPGLAVDPQVQEGMTEVCSPVSGTVVRVHPHAFVVAATTGETFLVHVGIDTVKLEGRGFVSAIQAGQTVQAGQVIMSYDPQLVTDAGYDPVIIVIAMEVPPNGIKELKTSDSPIKRGEPLFNLYA